MGRNEILKQLSKLSAADRRAIRVKLNELDGITDEDWDDDGELTEDERRLIEERIAAQKKNPAGSIPWAKAEARLNKRFGI
jgi:hypothetical protein